MKNKKKSALGVLAIACISALSVATATACKDEPPVTLNGFDVKENLEVAYGSTVDLEQPYVTDSTGEILDCWTLVTDDEGNYIHVTAGQFRAEDLDGYTITYVVRASDNTTYQKKTTVKVTGVGNTDLVIEADFEQFVSIGETLSINATCSDENASLTYTVTHKESGEKVALTDNTFVLSNKGVHTVQISTEDGSASYSYTIFAQAPAQEGEVEVFDDAWEAKEAFISGKRQAWSVTTTAECGIYDPFGREASFATFTTKTPNAYGIYINIREEQAYYEQLAAEGYTHVSMWIYMVSEKSHISVHDRDANGGFYRLDGPKLYPGEWTEFLVNLTEGQAAYKRSFNSCYSLYQNENHAYLQVDNSYEWNPDGGGDTMTFYLADIYAVKPVTITAVEGLDTEATVGETIDFSSYFEADCDLTYAITHRGETKAIEGSSYAFPANGTFTVTATPTARNFKGSASVEFTVEDGHVLNSTPVIKERAGDSVNVSMQELSLSFVETDGITPTVSEHRVYYKGEEIALTDGVFTATADGMYTVEVKGVYTKDGVEYATYQSVSVDVWSQATKYSVIDVNNLRAIRAWDWDNSSTTAAYGEYTVDGETGNYIKATAKGQSLVLYGKPMFSKAYYQAMNAQYENMNVLIGVYFAPAATEKTTNFRSIYHPAKAEWFDNYNDQWQSYQMSLSDFINVYDEVESRYEQYKTASYGAGTEGYEGAWLQLIGSQMSRTVYMDVTLGAEASEASAVLNTNCEIKIDQQNDLDEMLTVTLDGQAAKILSSEVYFNGAWVALEKNVFDPVWDGVYEIRINATTLDGITYKTFTTTFQTTGDPFETTLDTALHTVTVGNDFDMSVLFSDSYTYELEAWIVRGANKTAANVTVDGTVIDGETLSVGSYLIDVYATKGTGKFGKILYYTFTLDCLAEGDGALMWTEELTADNYKSQFKSYQYGSNQSLTGTSITTEIPEGKTGAFLKYAGSLNNTKEQMKVMAFGKYSKTYYQSLVNSAKPYMVKFDVYVENGLEDCTRTEVLYLSWNAEGTSFTTHGGKLALNTWHTITISLSTLVNNWDNSFLFGIQIPYGGYSTSDIMNFYLGNIRIEEEPMMWTEALTSANMEMQFKSYQYTSNQYMTGMSVTTEIPQGKTGSFLKYTGNPEKTKEQMKVVAFAKYTKAYYQSLLDSGKNYKLTFDVYVENGLEDCTRTEISYCYWNADGTSFTTHGKKLALDTWHTIEISLSTLVNNWDNPFLFGVQIPTGGYSTADIVNFYLGNIQLVESVENA